MWTPKRREVVALVALLDLAVLATPRGFTKTQTIAARHDIPLPFLEQITNRLAQGGLLQSRRGPTGGVRLARPAAEIRVDEVIRAVSSPRRAQTAASLEGLVLERLGEANAELERFLATMTLEELALRAERLGLSARPKSALSFDI